MRYLLTTLLLLSITACGPKPIITPEEKVYSMVLGQIEIAQGYARHCTKQDKEIKANMFGNMQYVVSKLAEQIAKHAPDSASDSEKLSYVQSKLDPHTQKIRKTIDTILEKEGCDSLKASVGKKLYTLFTTIHPAQFASMIQKSIEKESKISTISKKP